MQGWQHWPSSPGTWGPVSVVNPLLPRRIWGCRLYCCCHFHPTPGKHSDSRKMKEVEASQKGWGTPAVSCHPWGIPRCVLLLGMVTHLAESADHLPTTHQITGLRIESGYSFFLCAFSPLALCANEKNSALGEPLSPFKGNNFLFSTVLSR